MPSRYLRMMMRENIMDTIEELIKEHLPNDYEYTLETYKECVHEDWEERDKDTKELIGFISYFFLDEEAYDMIVVIAKGNIFSRAQWRILSKTLKTRNKEIQINSDSTNKKLHEFATRYGGYFEGDDIVFPKNI